MNAAQADLKKARIVIERLSEMLADSRNWQETNPIEQGAAEIMRQNDHALEGAIDLLNKAYLANAFYRDINGTKQ